MENWIQLIGIMGGACFVCSTPNQNYLGVVLEISMSS